MKPFKCISYDISHEFLETQNFGDQKKIILHITFLSFFQAEKTKPYQANVKIPRFFYEKFYFEQEKINLSNYLPEVMNW